MCSSPRVRTTKGEDQNKSISRSFCRCAFGRTFNCRLQLPLSVVDLSDISMRVFSLSGSELHSKSSQCLLLVCFGPQGHHTTNLYQEKKNLQVLKYFLLFFCNYLQHSLDMSNLNLVISLWAWDFIETSMCLLVEEMQVKHLLCRPGKQSLQERVIIRYRMHFNPTVLSLKNKTKN